MKGFGSMVMKVVKRGKDFILVDKKTGYVHDGFGCARSASMYAAAHDELDTKSLWRFSHHMPRFEYEALMEGGYDAVRKLYRL